MELPEGAKTIVAMWWPGVYYLVSTVGKKCSPDLAESTEQVPGAEAEPQKPYVTQIFRCYKDGFPKFRDYRFYREEYENLEQAKAGHATIVGKLARGQLKLKR